MNDKLILIQSQLKAPKSQFNKFGSYSYRNVEDILEALKPLLKEHKLSLTLTDSIEAIGSRVYVKATATVTDGENSVSVSAFARESDTRKGMDDSQLTGSTSSYARKYALNGLFLIDDTKDSDSMDNTKQPAKKPQPDIATDEQRSLISKKLAEQFLTTNDEIKNFLKENYGVNGILTKEDAQMVIDDLGAPEESQ